MVFFVSKPACCAKTVFITPKVYMKALEPMNDNLLTTCEISNLFGIESEVPENVCGENYIKKLHLIDSIAFKVMSHYLPIGLGERFTNLIVLTAKNIELQEILCSFFIKLDRLKILSLEDNEIVNIEGKSFNDLKNLEYLNLRNNKIQTIEKNLFQPLQSLIFLDLRNNKFSTIQASVFSNLQKLDYLYITNNVLNSFDLKAYDKILNFELVLVTEKPLEFQEKFMYLSYFFVYLVLDLLCGFLLMFYYIFKQK